MDEELKKAIDGMTAAVQDATAGIATITDTQKKQGDELAALRKRLDEESEQRKRELDAIANDRKKDAGLPGYKATGNPEKDFSLARAVVGHVRRWSDETKSWPERELLHEYAAHQKTQTGAVASEGGFLVPTTFMPNLIEVLRPNAVALANGVELLDGLTGGDVVIPAGNGGVTVYRKGEKQTGPESSETYDDLTLRRKELIGIVDLSKTLLQQTSGKAKTYAESRLGQEIGLRIDKDFFIGSGSQYVPLGLVNVPGILTQSWSGAVFTGATQTITDLVESMKGKMKAANSYRGKIVAFAHPDVFTKLRKAKDSTGRPLFFDSRDSQRVNNTEGGLFLGLPYGETTQLTNGATATLLIVAVMETVIAMWDQMEIFPSEHAGDAFARNAIKVRAVAYEDSLAYRPEAICSATALDAT